VTEDWAAVSAAVVRRRAELDMTQRELIRLSGVSKAIVGEIERNTVQRNRSDRTLRALSEALDWPPAHLDAVFRGKPLPVAGGPAASTDRDVPGRLTLIEHELRQINDHLERIDSEHNRLDDVATRIMAGVQRIIDHVAGQSR
jgi:transcriptional regulator with XRE-family HTH domain